MRDNNVEELKRLIILIKKYRPNILAIENIFVYKNRNSILKLAQARGVIIAAAATSVPDTILSIKDARKGNYNDAISNALGSNIFDICFAFLGPSWTNRCRI